MTTVDFKVPIKALARHLDGKLYECLAHSHNSATGPFVLLRHKGWVPVGEVYHAYA